MPATPTRALPTELWHLILAHCDTSSLARCVRASRRLHAIALPHLYRHVDIRAGSARVALATLPTRSKRLRHAVPVAPLVHTLTLTHSGRAAELVLPPLPNLDTLRLVRDGKTLLAALPERPVSYRLAASPRALVLKNMPLLYTPIDRLFRMPNLADSVTRVTVACLPDKAVVGTDMKLEAGGCGADGLLSAVPPSATHFTVILYTESPGTQWRPQPRPRNSAGLATDGNLAVTWVGRFCAGLAAGLASRPAPLRVDLVNFGALDRLSVNASDWQPRTVELKVEAYLRDQLRRTNAADVSGVGGRVRFMPLGAWVEESDWASVFAADEVRHWQRA